MKIEEINEMIGYHLGKAVVNTLNKNNKMFRLIGMTELYVKQYDKGTDIDNKIFSYHLYGNIGDSIHNIGLTFDLNKELENDDIPDINKISSIVRKAYMDYELIANKGNKMIRLGDDL